VSEHQPEDSLEHERRRATTYEQYAKFGIYALCALFLIIVIVEMLVVSPKINRAAEDWSRASKATADAYEGQILQSATKLTAVLDQAGPELLQGARNFNALSAGLSREVPPTIASINSLARTLDARTDGLMAEGQLQIKQSGDAVAKLIGDSDETLLGMQPNLIAGSEAFARMMKDGSVLIESANPRINALLENASHAIVTLDTVGQHATLVVDDLHASGQNFAKITTDLYDYEHGLTHPVTPKGFKGFLIKAGRVFQIVGGDTYLGLKLFQLGMRP